MTKTPYHSLENLKPPSEEQCPPCSICLDVPRLYGILSSCQHPFCLACITVYWNRQADPALRCCPVCRGYGSFLLPSNDWLTHNSPEKLLKIRRRRIPESEDIGTVLAHLRAAMARPCDRQSNSQMNQRTAATARLRNQHTTTNGLLVDDNVPICPGLIDKAK